MAKKTGNKTKANGRAKAESGLAGPRRTTSRKYGCGGKVKK